MWHFPLKWQTAALDASHTLNDKEVHIWWLPHSAAPRTLQQKEAGNLLRSVLAGYVGQVPETLQFGREPRGRPFLLAPHTPDFNLSDTGGGALIAVARAIRVGIDIECIDRNPAHRALASRYFSPQEAAALAMLDNESARREFLALWTAKEAACKATGTGIQGHLARWRFAVPAEIPLLQAAPKEAGDPAAWWFLRISPDTPYTAVIAGKGDKPLLRGWRLK